MTYSTLQVRQKPKCLSVTLHRPERQNSISVRMLQELHEVLDEVERDAECPAMVLEGSGGVFCTGMDFEDAAAQSAGEIEAYIGLLRRFTLTPKIVFCKLDGRVAGGGVGLAAASDLVVATARSTFSLPEALWGLLPCCVLPFLIRRTGVQPAYKLALTTSTIPAAEALACHLVDEISDTPDEAIRRLLVRSMRVRPETVGDLKQYFRKMWMVNAEMERVAVEELSRLLAQPAVRDNIDAFVNQGQFPWERER